MGDGMEDWEKRGGGWERKNKGDGREGKKKKKKKEMGALAEVHSNLTSLIITFYYPSAIAIEYKP